MVNADLRSASPTRCMNLVIAEGRQNRSVRLRGRQRNSTVTAQNRMRGNSLNGRADQSGPAPPYKLCETSVRSQLTYFRPATVKGWAV